MRSYYEDGWTAARKGKTLEEAADELGITDPDELETLAAGHRAYTTGFWRRPDESENS